MLQKSYWQRSTDLISQKLPENKNTKLMDIRFYCDKKKHKLEDSESGSVILNRLQANLAKLSVEDPYHPCRN